VRIARLAPSRRVWIFDLDNTLHDATARMVPAMHEQINAFLRREFSVDEEGANRMRRDFWLRYGTTLNGLMRHHGVEPRRFLYETHVFPELADLVVHENALKHALSRLGGTKLVFSNAPRHYVEEVLRGVLRGAHGPALAERARRIDLTDLQAAIAAGRFRFVVPGDEEWPPPRLGRKAPRQR
jgi:phosphoglycolate phosphatase-like HAD superfamily hydrolase